MATGVAKPRAQGQEITSTLIPLSRLYPRSRDTKYQIRVVTKAIAITVGTKIPETLSAIFAIGAFDAPADCTISIIWENVVSLPTFVALHLIAPERFIVEAKT